MDSCIFCMIKDGKIPSKAIYEDEQILAFNDINPQAPVHVLVIPKIHIDSLDDVDESNIQFVSHLIACIPEIAKKAGITNGYRVISNCGKDGCQSVEHLHFHILGGAKLPEKLA